MEKNNLYDPVIDSLRITAILAVIFIHSTTRILEVTSYHLINTLPTLFANQIFRFAVPLFFMISGIVLELNYNLHESYLAFLKKRIGRIFIPYIFWSVIYYYFIYAKNRDPNFINAIFRGDASYQLYFIPSLLILYLLFPLIHRCFGIIGNKFVLIFLGLIELALLYVDYNIKPFYLYLPIRVMILNYFVFIFGIKIAQNKQKFIDYINKWKGLLGFTGIVFALFVFWEGFAGFLKSHNYLTFYSQWRPSVLIYTLSLSGFLYWAFGRLSKFTKQIKLVAKFSFFVFFIHVLILEILWYVLFKNIYLNFQNLFFTQIVFDVLFFLSVAIISYALAYCCHKLPYLSKITG
jgi:probable poly-beta-1,6-N-acetyl-D-glucosamine export protein